MIADLTLTPLAAHAWGNKAARLSEARAAGLAVPAGLCVDYFTARQSPGSVSDLLAAWLRLYRPRRVVIRMSSTQEDQLTAAHAGQTTSVLDCTPDSDKLMQVLERLVLPYATPWATQDGGLSFIFQCQVEAQLGGVAFLIGDRLVVEAKPYSTSAITAGAPPAVMVEMDGDNLRASGDIQTWPVRALGVSLKAVCQVLQRHFSFDVDVEWAWYQGILYVLQVRPVTTNL